DLGAADPGAVGAEDLAFEAKRTLGIDVERPFRRDAARRGLFLLLRRRRLDVDLRGARRRWGGGRGLLGPRPQQETRNDQHGERHGTDELSVHRRHRKTHGYSW